MTNEQTMEAIRVAVDRRKRHRREALQVAEMWMRSVDGIPALAMPHVKRAMADCYMQGKIDGIKEAIEGVNTQQKENK